WEPLAGSLPAWIVARSSIAAARFFSAKTVQGLSDTLSMLVDASSVSSRPALSWRELIRRPPLIAEQSPALAAHDAIRRRQPLADIVVASVGTGHGEVGKLPARGRSALGVGTGRIRTESEDVAQKTESVLSSAGAPH